MALPHFLPAYARYVHIQRGKLVVLMGDFRQILPVVRRGRRADIVNATLKTSSLWAEVTTLSLTENMRVKKIMGENPSIEREKKYTDFTQNG